MRDGGEIRFPGLMRFRVYITQAPGFRPGLRIMIGTQEDE